MSLALCLLDEGGHHHSAKPSACKMKEVLSVFQPSACKMKEVFLVFNPLLVYGGGVLIYAISSTFKQLYFSFHCLFILKQMKMTNCQ